MIVVKKKQQKKIQKMSTIKTARFENYIAHNILYRVYYMCTYILLLQYS